MRLLFILVTITLLAEAKKRRLDRKKKIKPEEDDLPHRADVFPEKFIPVPFGHIFKEGFQPSLKMPLDLLELDMKYTKHVRTFDSINKSNGIKEKPRDLVKPNLFQSGKIDTFEDNAVKSDAKKDDSKTKDRKTWHDLVTNQARNLGDAPERLSHGPPRMISKDTNFNLTLADPDYKPKEQFLSKSSFNLEVKRREDVLNWTTCEEFGRKGDFHPNDVINIDWIPFYAWASDEIQRSAAFVHRFSIPTVKMVQKYKENFGTYLNQTLDWNSPKLHLKSNMEMLLIAADRRGGFNGIPYNEVPMSMKNTKLTLPLISLRLKILDPYLAMMLCDYQYATIMAVSGNEPNTVREIRAEAAALKFHGRGYPVARDVEAELTAARLERYSKIQRQKDMFLEDHAGSDFPIEV